MLRIVEPTPSHGPSAPWKRRVLALSFVLSFIATVVFLLCLYRWTSVAAKSKGWPMTEGVVIASEFEAAIAKVPGKRVFEYRYNVASTDYTGSKIGFGTRSFPQPAASGTRVRVYYDPNEPDFSVINPGLEHSSYLPLYGLAVVLLIINLALGMNLFVRRTRRK